MDTADKYMLVKKYEQLQEERLETHRIFDEAHKIYLSSGPNYDFATFRKLVKDVTQDFKRIIVDIADIESQLRKESDVVEIANIIKDTELKEKKKLELATHIQLLKQSKQDHPGKPSSGKLSELSSELEEVEAEIEVCVKKVSSLSTTILP